MPATTPPYPSPPYHHHHTKPPLAPKPFVPESAIARVKAKKELHLFFICQSSTVYNNSFFNSFPHFSSHAPSLADRSGAGKSICTATISELTTPSLDLDPILCHLVETFNLGTGSLCSYSYSYSCVSQSLMLRDHACSSWEI